MSYILEALRRAESERERGQVPRLHSQAWSGQGGPEATGAQEAQGRRLWLPALGLALLLGAAAAFWLWPEPAAMTTPPPAPHADARAQAPADPAPAVRAAAPREAAVKSALPEAHAPAASVPWPLPPPPLTLPPAAAAKPTPAASAASSVQPKALAALSPALRAELPALQVGGAMHSPTPANRMLILNGQVYREGEQIAPGLRLEQIQLRSAVLSYKGQSLRLDY